jgi:hypothetical protein
LFALAFFIQQTISSSNSEKSCEEEESSSSSGSSHQRQAPLLCVREALREIEFRNALFSKTMNQKNR